MQTERPNSTIADRRRVLLLTAAAVTATNAAGSAFAADEPARVPDPAALDTMLAALKEHHRAWRVADGFAGFGDDAADDAEQDRLWGVAFAHEKELGGARVGTSLSASCALRWIQREMRRDGSAGYLTPVDENRWQMLGRVAEFLEARS